MKTLTIFTPTYNRAYILPKLYDSIVNQTNKDFEWLIVDDGSSDNTEILVNSWIKECKIIIRYIYQENGGKMRAHNKGVLNTNTELFLCVDSDDHLKNDSVEKIINIWLKEKDKGYAGIIAYKGKNENETITEAHFPNLDNCTLSGLYKKGFYGDTSLVYRSEILKNHLFPEIEGEKFVTENYIYDQIDREYKMYVLKEVFIISEYLPDGLSKNSNSLIQKNPKGWAMYYNQRAFYENNIILKMKYLANYIYYCHKGNIKILKNSRNKILCFLAYPLWILLLIKKKNSLKKENM